MQEPFILSFSTTPLNEILTAFNGNQIHHPQPPTQAEAGPVLHPMAASGRWFAEDPHERLTYSTITRYSAAVCTYSQGSIPFRQEEGQDCGAGRVPPLQLYHGCPSLTSLSLAQSRTTAVDIQSANSLWTKQSQLLQHLNSLWTKQNQLLQHFRYSIRTRRAQPRQSTSLQIFCAPHFKQYKAISTFLTATLGETNSMFSPKTPESPKLMTNAVLATSSCKEEKEIYHRNSLLGKT